MSRRTIIDGNAFYEIDEECLREQKRKACLKEERVYEKEGKDNRKNRRAGQNLNRM